MTDLERELTKLSGSTNFAIAQDSDKGAMLMSVIRAHLADPAVVERAADAALIDDEDAAKALASVLK